MKFSKKWMSIFVLFTTVTMLTAGTAPLKDLSDLNGNWHLHVMDGKAVQKARAILDFHPKSMVLEGFDGCNRISGKLLRSTGDRFFSKLTSTRMACRQNIHRYVSRGLHTTIKEGFTVTEGKRYGMDGITLKSRHHDLFFKKMGGKRSILDGLK